MTLVKCVNAIKMALSNLKAGRQSSHELFPRQTQLVVGVDSNHPRECDCNVTMLVAILDMIMRLKGDHFEAAKGGGEDIRRIAEMPEGGGGGASTSIPFHLSLSLIGAITWHHALEGAERTVPPSDSIYLVEKTWFEEADRRWCG